MFIYINLNNTNNLVPVINYITITVFYLFSISGLGSTRQPLLGWCWSTCSENKAGTKLGQLHSPLLALVSLLVKGWVQNRTPPPTKSSRIEPTTAYLVPAKKWGWFINIATRGVWGE